MKIEVRAFPVPVKSDIELELPKVVAFLGLDARGGSGVPKTLHVIALVEVRSKPERYRMSMAQEGLEFESPALSMSTIGHAAVEKPRPAHYWLFLKP